MAVSFSENVEELPTTLEEEDTMEMEVDSADEVEGEELTEVSDSDEEVQGDFNDSTSDDMEHYSSADELDRDLLEQVLESAYTRRPASSFSLDPVERDSLLLYDKDWYEDSSGTWIKQRRLGIVLSLAMCLFLLSRECGEDVHVGRGEGL